VARVLRPGGRLALLWSGSDRNVPWLRALWAGGVDLGDQRAAALDAKRRDRHVVDLGPSAPHFAEPERHLLKWTTTMARADLIGMVGTYSAVIVMEAEARQAFDAGLEHFLDTDADTAGKETFEVPMRCLCWRADRLAGPVD
jgi:hypothetical protein